MTPRISTMGTAAITLLLLMAGTSRAFACDPAVYGANPTDSNPDDWAIQQCLNKGGTTNLLWGTPGYLIAHTLTITQPGTTLAGPDPLRARLVPTASLDDLSAPLHRILQAENVDNVTLLALNFDGQKDSRNGAPCALDGHPFDYGKNMMITGNGFRITNVISQNALCGSAAEVQGAGFEIANNLFKNNGYPEDVYYGIWSDGLTVWSCGGGSSIHDNQFVDNTDVDLVIGGGDGGACSVYGNQISNFNVRAFAGIHVGYFPNGSGNHGGISYSGNTISAGVNLLAFGIIVGKHPWDSTEHLASAGTVSSNSVSGSVINLQIEADSRGVATGTVTANNLSGPQGTWGYGWCRTSANYAVYPVHAGVISYDAGYTWLKFDNGSCGQ